MKQRQLLELQSWFLASLVLSASVLVPAYASPRPQTHSTGYRRINDYDYFDSSSPEDTGLVVGSARQDDFSSIGSLISLGIKVFPLIMQAVNAFSGSGGSRQRLQQLFFHCRQGRNCSCGKRSFL